MILSLLTALIISNVGINKEILLYPAKTIKNEGLLHGGISVSKDLPEEFYGTWAVRSTIIETNNPRKSRRPTNHAENWANRE